MKTKILLYGNAFAVFLLIFSLLGYSGVASARHRHKAKTGATNNTFLASDDYADKKEIKNVFLKDPQYAKMTEDFSRNGADEFDWGWAAADLDLHKYKSAHVVVKDDFGVLDPEFVKYAGQIFNTVAKRLGLNVVDGKTPADLELGFDVVGYDADSHYAFVTVVKPSVELEIRAKDLKTGNDLFLARNTEHGNDPKAALTDTAQDLLTMLR